MLLLYASETKEKETPPFRSGPDTATPTDGVGHRRRGIGGLHFPSPALRLSGEALWRGPLAAENKCAGKRGEWRVPGNGNGDGGEEEGLWLASRHAIPPPPPPHPLFERRGGEATRLDWESAGGTWLRLASPPPLLVFLFYKFPPVSTYVSSRVCLASNGAKVKVHRWDQTCAATQQSHGQVGPDAISRTRSRVLLMFRLTILVLVFHEVK